MIGKKVSHYEVLEKLGEGGMGEVYLAQDTELDRKVALKFLPSQLSADADTLARFKREAKAAAALNHPNIVTVYEVGEYEGKPFIAMAYVDGELLSDRIHSKELTVDQSAEIVAQICDGLAKAHEAGVVHRDIKPDNILIDHDGRVKILDFGLATREGVPKVTQVDSTIGTIYYMSPEQASGDDVDQRSDLFSLGVVLYEMLTGQPPFAGDHSAAVIYSITNESPQPLARFNNQTSPELQRILTKMLEKDPGARYQSASDLAVDLRHAQGGSTGADKTSSGMLKFVLPTSAVVFIAVILLLVFKPFKVEISPDQSALASENKLAIMYFENMADRDDNDRLGEIVTDLLITNLSRSEDLKVVSSQRLYDILKLKGREGEKVIDRSTSTEVAREAGAKWMMQGSILQVEPTFVISSQLIEMESGDVVTSQRVTGAPGESIFDIVDRMTGDTKGELHIPLQASLEAPASVADVTTSSLEAYKFYLEGEELQNKFFIQEARESYKKAVAADSTFVMAWIRLVSTGGGSHFQESIFALEKAKQFSSKATEKERLFVDGFSAGFAQDDEKMIQAFEQLVAKYPDEKYAYSILAGIYRRTKQAEKAITHLNALMELDPLYKNVYNDLAYTHKEVGDFDKALWAINKYIELAPDEPNPYDSRGDMYAHNGMLDEAIASYKKAIALKPDFFPSVRNLGHMYLYKRDYRNAEAQYRVLVSSSDPLYRSWGRYDLVNVKMFQGKLTDGAEQMQAAMAADDMEAQSSFPYFAKVFARVRVLAEQGNPDQALSEAEAGFDVFYKMIPSTAPDFANQMRLTYAAIQALCGQTEAALETVSSLKSMAMESNSLNVKQAYFAAKGAIAFEKGRYDEAIEASRTAVEMLDNFSARYWLGVSYFKAERYAESISEFTKIHGEYTTERIEQPVDGVKTHYYLGVAYDESGKKALAAKEFDTFLNTWKDADPGLDGIDDAKQRLKAIRQSS